MKNDEDYCKGTLTSVTTRIVEKDKIWIKFPSSYEDLSIAKRSDNQDFLSATGAIICARVGIIPILKPSIHGDEEHFCQY